MKVGLNTYLQDNFVSEAWKLKELNGVGGAPELLAVCSDEPRFVMGFIEGETLHNLFYTGRLSPLELIAVLQRVVKRLDEIHGKNIVHCDFKADNVMVTGTEEGHDLDVHIIDFGMSKHVGEWIAFGRSHDSDTHAQ